MKKQTNYFLAPISLIISFLWYRFLAAQLMSFQIDHEPILLYTKEYLLEHFLAFGGISELFSRFIMQFYINPWLGALALALLTVFLVNKAFKLSHSISLSVLLGAVSLAYITFSHAPLFLIVAAIIIFRTLEEQEEIKNVTVQWLFRFIAFPTLLWLTGSWAWLYLLAVIIRNVISENKNYRQVLLLTAFSTITAFIAYRFIWSISLSTLILGSFNFHPLFSITFMIAASITLIHSVFCKKEHKIATYLLYASALLILLYSGISVLKDPQQRTEIWRQYIKNEQYATLIKAADHQIPQDRIQTLYLNYALAKEELLFDKLFSYPQTYGTEGLLPNPHRGITTRNIDEFWFIGHFYYEIGYIDKAHRIACDELVFSGLTPSYTKLMIDCLLADGHTNAAEKYIYQLEHTLFYKKSARQYREMLSNTLKREKYFSKIKELEPLETKIISYDPTENLLTTLKRNVKNPLAFNYLCAYNLLNKTPGFLVDNVWVLKELGYNTLPSHYQEALLIYQLEHPKEHIDLEGLHSNQQTVYKFIEFGNQFSKDKQPVYANYKKQFSSMYVLYWFFTEGVS